MSNRVKMMQIILKIKLIKIHKKSTHKNPPFAPQLSNRIKIQPKNPSHCPYNCRFVWILGVLLILIADTFDENIATLKAPINPPNCQMCVILVHFRAIKHLPLAPQLSIYVNLIAK